MKRWQHRTWKCIVGVIAAVVILIATLIGLFRLFAPLVPGYRERAQTWASEALGRPVSIAEMGATWGLYGPELTLENVELLSRDRQRVVMEAHEIRLGFTARAILHGQFSRPSRIILIQPQMTVERDTDGSFGVLGLEGSLNLSREHTDWRQVADEAFAQEARVLVRGGKLILIDMRTLAAPLVFNGIRLDLNNSAESHRIDGRMQLPVALGERLSFSARIKGTGLKPKAWHWQSDIRADALSLPQLLSFWPTYAGRFSSGQLDLLAALSGDGTDVNQAHLDINARGVIPTGITGANGGFDLLSGSLDFTRNASGWMADATHVQLRRGQDIWPVSRFDLRYNRGPDGLASWSGSASFLRLQDVVSLTTWLPPLWTADTLRLQRLSPSGDVTDVNIAVQRNGQVLGNWSLRGKFDDLGLHADGKIPGFSSLSGELAANQDGGTLRLAGRNATVTFPHLFREPLAFSTLGANVRFDRDTQGWHFSTEDFTASNPDIRQVTAKGTLLLPSDGSSPIIDLQASAQNVNVKNKSVYLPVGIMPKEVVDWLDSAIVSGDVPTGSLVLRGPLRDFPYDKGQGLFDIRFHLVHGVLDYASGWPPVENLDADVEFKNQGMSVAVQHGSQLGDDIAGARARFADLRNGILQIHGTARGGAAAALTFLRTAASLKKRFGHILDDIQASGRSDVSLDLVLPVEHVEGYTLRGVADLRDVSLAMTTLQNWPVSRLNGKVEFGNAGIKADALSGEFLGEPLHVSLQSDSVQDMTLIAAEGGVNAAQLSTALPPAFKKSLTGTTTWKLTGRLPNDPAQSSTGLSLLLTSDLQGLALNLPAPFDKPADVTRPISMSIGLAGEQQMLVHFRYGNTLSGLSGFTEEPRGWVFDRGDLVLGVGESSMPVAAGLTISGRLPELSLDDWKPYFPASDSVAEFVPPFLHSVDVELGRFSGFGQKIDQLHIRLIPSAEDWKLDLDSAPIAGQISLPHHTDAAHPILVDMQRVTWVRKPAAQKTGAHPRLNPHKVPPLRITIKQLRYNDMNLDNLEAQLEADPEGVNLKSLSISNPDFHIQGNGRWITQPSGGQETTLSIQLQSRAVEKTLQAFGYAPGITGRRGELRASLNWPGGPLEDVLPVLNGKLHVKLDNGRLLELKPGAGRIFGLLSLNALPRHLLLNFSDVLGKGFAYDSVEGDFTLQNGDAYTSDFTVSGPAAKIHMVGRTGLAKHDFDEAVVVVPSVGSSLPILGALAGGVGVGAVVFLLSEIFRKPISEVGESRYRLTGTWDNPILTKIIAPETANAQH